MIAKILIGVFIVLLFVAFTIYTVYYFTDFASGCSTKIKFEIFRSMYAIVPNHWDLYDGWVSYHDPDERNYSCCFSWFDTIRYLLWKLRMDISHETDRENEEKAKLLAAFQRDIERFKKEGERQCRK